MFVAVHLNAEALSVCLWELVTDACVLPACVKTVC